jgi:hypothetical protein
MSSSGVHRITIHSISGKTNPVFLLDVCLIFKVTHFRSSRDGTPRLAFYTLKIKVCGWWMTVIFGFYKLNGRLLVLLVVCGESGQTSHASFGTTIKNPLHTQPTVQQSNPTRIEPQTKSFRIHFSNCFVFYCYVSNPTNLIHRLFNTNFDEDFLGNIKTSGFAREDSLEENQTKVGIKSQAEARAFLLAFELDFGCSHEFALRTVGFPNSSLHSRQRGSQHDQYGNFLLLIASRRCGFPFASLSSGL